VKNVKIWVISSVFIFWQIFATWRQKKGLTNPTKGLLKLKKKIATS
jgi:hypothetical protein